MNAAPVLETPRLRLRAHRAEDHAACLAIWSDPAVVRFVGGKPVNAEGAWDRLLRYAGMWSLLGYGLWAVEEKASGRYVGDIGFADFKRDITPSLHGMLEFAWILATHAQGKGYASEAVAAADAWGAAQFGDAQRSACIILPENLASIRVAEKLGFRRLQATAYRDETVLIFTRDGLSR